MYIYIYIRLNDWTMPGGATTCLNKQDSKAKCLMYYTRCKQLTFDKALFRP